MTNVRQVVDVKDLGRQAADAAIELLQKRQAAGGIPTVVLTGGRAGAEFLRALSDDPRPDVVDWQRVRLLWGDERWLPSGDAERNDRLFEDTLARVVELDPALVYRVPTADSGTSLDGAAESYASVVDSIERIDLAVNGVGEDGHVASLFPGRDELLGVDSSVPAAIPVRHSPKAPSERVSLSIFALRRADQLWLFATGIGKAEAVRATLEPQAFAELLPAARIAEGKHATLWADSAALSLVAGESR